MDRAATVIASAAESMRTTAGHLDETRQRFAVELHVSIHKAEQLVERLEALGSVLASTTESVQQFSAAVKPHAWAMTVRYLAFCCVIAFAIWKGCSL